MRTPVACLVGMLAFCAAGFALLSWSQGQERSGDPVATAPVPPAVLAVADAAVSSANAPAAAQGAADLSKRPLLQRQMDLTARRGADWLCGANGPDGRFIYGYVPDLKRPLEGDHYLRQAGAAFALARAARFTGDQHQIAVARQTVLTLLLDTTADSENPHGRSTTLPSAAVNRLAAAGLLVLAINELPAPGDDLLQQSEELCAFICRQQQSDGSLQYSDTPEAANDPEGINYYPGEALYGLMLSQRHRPAPWKTNVVRKALGYYQPWWREHKTMALVPWHTAAYAEAYLLTGEKPFADCVYEMTDWLCGLQYVLLDAQHPLWVGGFMSWLDGKAVLSAPQVGSASYAEGLADAWRVAAKANDGARCQRYREALERCLQFLATLQYTEVNTQHFADWYRPVLLGAFYASHQDGTVRLDYTQHAVCALVQYLTFAAGDHNAPAARQAAP